MPQAYTKDQLVEQPATGLFPQLGWQTVSALDETITQIGQRWRSRFNALPPTLRRQAVAVGNATAGALALRPRNKAAYFYPNSAWFTPMHGGSYEFFSHPGVRDLDARVIMHYYAIRANLLVIKGVRIKERTSVLRRNRPLYCKAPKTAE